MGLEAPPECSPEVQPMDGNGLGLVKGMHLMLCSEIGPNHNLWIQRLKLKNMH